jgi:hypothetical protein
VLALLAGCDSSPPVSVTTTGSAQLAVHLTGDVSRVTVTVSAPDMAPLSTHLELTDGVWGGILGDIPAGEHRTFLAQAFNSSNVLRYEGRAEDVTITAGAMTLVSLTLQDVSTPSPWTNEVPLIDSLVATPTSVAPGGDVSLTAIAHDPNPEDTVSFAWSAPSGHFSDPTQASTTWTAPTTQGPVSLSLRVTDSRGAFVTASLTVRVSTGSGAARVEVGFNTAPRVVALTSSQSPLVVGQQTALSVSATDADGDSLGYQWSATCAGSFTGASTASPTFTPSALPTARCNNCQLSVVVRDGRGGQNTGSLALCVSTSEARDTPPVVTRSYQSSLTASAGQQLTFEVEAMDPAGSVLGFTWAASTGTLDTVSTGANSSRITWTAPTCVNAGTTPSIVATVGNASGLTVTRSFTVTGLPACITAGWTPTGALTRVRYNHTATRLADGRVLVAGGLGDTATEVYDPTTRSWSVTGSLSTRRSGHTATLLADGRVLVAGGYLGASTLATVEVYDPATGSWSLTGSMSSPRFSHTATLLADGRVLVSGGYGGSSHLETAEVYDPATGFWSPTGSMSTRRGAHSATRLSTGKVLVQGGVTSGGGYLVTAEVYDPATGSWSPTGSMAEPHYGRQGVLLADGRVLVVGGTSYSAYLATAEVYDPATGSWSPTGSLSSPRDTYTATLLPDGKVLVAGGTSGGGTYLATAEVYDPATGSWSSTSSMSSKRYAHTATPLPDGKVLVMGGSSGGGSYLATAELYDPGLGP